MEYSVSPLLGGLFDEQTEQLNSLKDLVLGGAHSKAHQDDKCRSEKRLSPLPIRPGPSPVGLATNHYAHLLKHLLGGPILPKFGVQKNCILKPKGERPDEQFRTFYHYHKRLWGPLASSSRLHWTI